MRACEQADVMDAGNGRSDWLDMYVGWMSSYIAVALGGYEGL